MAVKKTLLEDIANQLNVSKTLVSMVINGKGDSYGISKKTQQLVLDKALEMEYTPNVFARALRTGKSQLIALLVADISNPYYSNIAKYVEKELAEKKQELLELKRKNQEKDYSDSKSSFLSEAFKSRNNNHC